MIPKIIHYCWFGENQLDKKSKKCIESWKKYCPDFKIIEWNEKNYDVTKNKYMHQAYQAKKWGFVPDYARLDIIYNYGGIYLDTDVEIIKPLNELLSQKGFCGIEDGSQYIALGLGFGAEKKDSTIKVLLDSYEKLSFIQHGKPNLTPAPIINAAILKDMYTYQKNKITTCGTLTVYPPEYFCPINRQNGKLTITKKTYSIHHYAASWENKSNKIRGNVYRFINRFFGQNSANFIRKLFGKKRG